MRVIRLLGVCLCFILFLGACSSPAPDGQESGFRLTAGLMEKGLTSVNAFTLPDKRILLIGIDSPPDQQTRVYLYDPARNTFSRTANAPLPQRAAYAATRLANGKVLITGGKSQVDFKALNIAEIYDPRTNTFSLLASPMNQARVSHTATLLSDGRVLIAGGRGLQVNPGDPDPSSDTAEIFDPVTETFTPVSGKMTRARTMHRAVALKDGNILILGGGDADGLFVPESELYDPVSQTFSPSGAMIVERYTGFAATLLPDGNVLVTGGMGPPGKNTLKSAELYQTATGVFSALPDMQDGRANHFSILFDRGRYVLVGGGHMVVIGGARSSLELYDIEKRRFISMPRGMYLGRNYVENAAVALDNGDVMVFGGGAILMFDKGLSSAEKIRASDRTVELSGGLHTFRTWHTSTTLQNGKVLIAGGFAPPLFPFPSSRLASAELFDPATGRFRKLPDMIAERAFHTATLLADGSVLMAGGVDPGEDAEIYHPDTGRFSATGAMTVTRTGGHAAIRLLDGRVLVTGGVSPSDETLSGAEVYNPATRTFSPTSRPMTTPRTSHVMSLLSDGRVLITGGGYDIELASVIDTAEIYDPATDTFTALPKMSSARSFHTATTLADGRVLVAGGFNAALDILSDAELYNPATGKFEPLSGGMTHARMNHSATRLPNGAVLLAGGRNETHKAEADLFSPATNRFFKSYEMIYRRFGHAASLLHTGQVLMTGGKRQVTFEASEDLHATEIFTP